MFEEQDGMFNDMFKEMRTRKGKPMVYGFNIKVGPEGKPQVEEFGNVRPRKKKVLDEREPLVNVMERDKIINVVAEIPGVEKKNIDLRISGKKLTIHIPNKYNKEVSLPTAVENGTKATYKNGVLEVTLHKKPEAKKQKRIKVE